MNPFNGIERVAQPLARIMSMIVCESIQWNWKLREDGTPSTAATTRWIHSMELKVHDILACVHTSVHDSRIHSMELKDAILALHAGQLDLENPFNGIERQEHSIQAVLPEALESIQWNWKAILDEGGAEATGLNPFNGIERSLTHRSSSNIIARIHSMELKEPPNGMPNLILLMWIHSMELKVPPAPALWGSSYRIHSMELKATTRKHEEDGKPRRIHSMELKVKVANFITSYVLSWIHSMELKGRAGSVYEEYSGRVLWIHSMELKVYIVPL